MKWRRRVDGDQLRRGLAVKAAALGGEVSFVVAAREEVRTNDPELVTITADDLFA